jgi:hypothetical protein
MLGRLTDQPCERNERSGGEKEEHRVVCVEGEARRECDGREHERAPENRARHES